MTQEPRDRAIRVALALLHQPSAADAAGAWQVVGRLGQVGAELRSAIENASVPEVRASAGDPQAPTVEPWPAAANELAQRLEEAAAWWTGRSGFPWSTWDEASATALGSLLCELDALAAALLSAAGSDVAARPGRPGRPGGPMRPAGPAGRRVPRRRRGVLGGRLVPVVGLAAAAVIGVIGGITIAATQVSHIELPSRSIMSEPVPYTRHDSEPGGAAAGTAKAPPPADAGAAGIGVAAASRNLSAPMPPTAAPSSAPGPSAAAPGSHVTPRQGSKMPQPREAGFPPSRSAPQPDPDQLGTMVSGVGAQAEQLQEAQLRELAEQMQDAMGLAIGLRTR